MSGIMTLLRFLTSLMLVLLPIFAAAQSYDDVITAELRPGWRLPNGTHMAALHLSLAPGWKTYWRAPGDAGIPPEFNWRGARNVAAVEVLWPAPEVFYDSGMRSIGYDGEVVLPLRVTPSADGQDARLGGTVDIGICKDICIPHSVRVQIMLPSDQRKADPMIAAALAGTPLSGAEAGIGAVTCQIEPARGGLVLHADIPTTGLWDMVIETSNPEIWVSEPKTTRNGQMMQAKSMLRHSSGAAFALDRSALRFTLLSPQGAVDIQGCKG